MLPFSILSLILLFILLNEKYNVRLIRFILHIFILYICIIVIIGVPIFLMDITPKLLKIFPHFLIFLSYFLPDILAILFYHIRIILYFLINPDLGYFLLNFLHLNYHEILWVDHNNLDELLIKKIKIFFIDGYNKGSKKISGVSRRFSIKSRIFLNRNSYNNYFNIFINPNSSHIKFEKEVSLDFMFSDKFSIKSINKTKNKDLKNFYFFIYFTKGVQPLSLKNSGVINLKILEFTKILKDYSYTEKDFLGEFRTYNFHCSVLIYYHDILIDFLKKESSFSILDSKEEFSNILDICTLLKQNSYSLKNIVSIWEIDNIITKINISNYKDVVSLNERTFHGLYKNFQNYGLENFSALRDDEK